MKVSLKYALAAATVMVATQAVAEIIFYEHEEFQGRTFNSTRPITDFQNYGFNDRASSAVVLNERWEVCEHANFGGACFVLRPGRYPHLAAMRLNDRVSSARTAGRTARSDEGRYAPPPLPVYDQRPRRNERLYEANVTSVRAVVGTSDRRCWIERERVGGNPGDSNVPGAVMGALIGGVLGHQIGGGRGNDLATAIGAVTGAAVGGGSGSGSGSYARNVRRCENEVSGSRPEYWDVTYAFRGQQHRVQMTSPPGPTITVNRQGEPRW